MEWLMLIAFLAIGCAGFYIMRKVDNFIEKKYDCIDNTNRANLIHLGFDAPYLAEDLIIKMKIADQGHHLMEIVVYTGTEKEMKDMLLTGKLDYIILTHAVTEWDDSQGKCKELLLQPRCLNMNEDDLHIEAQGTEPIKADVFWIPRWIGREKDFFTKLLMEQL